jgi:endoglucanase
MKKLFLLLLIPFLWFSCSTGGNSSGIEEVSLDKTSMVLVKGKTTKLTVTITPEDAKKKEIIWSTSDESVATVTEGTVTAVAEGTATITVTSKADSKKTAQCAVTVKTRVITELGAKDSLSGKTAAQFFKDNYVYAGWNLGNAFDATSGYGDWTRKIDQNFLKKVKDEGFSMIRIPVTWNKYIGSTPSYTINAAMLNELAQVVDWAYEADLVTIINIHHDGSQNNAEAEGGWLSLKRLKTTDRETITNKFVKVWEQIAEKFKDYGDWLIFEPFNELHNGGWGWNITDSTEYAIINELNQKFTDTVRAAGGKNTQRFLVVQPLCAKPHQAMASTFKTPTDSATGKQIVSMHYYEPEGFALKGTTTAWSDKTAISNDFKNYANKFTKNGIPLILGECGATYQNKKEPDKTAAAGYRLVYMEHLCMEARANDIIPIYWDNGTIYASSVGENFGLWDRTKGGTLNVFPGMQEVIDAIINGVWQ